MNRQFYPLIKEILADASTKYHGAAAGDLCCHHDIRDSFSRAGEHKWTVEIDI
jgi:transposase InsO family protein